MTTMSRRVMTILCLGLMTMTSPVPRSFIGIQCIEARSGGDHDFSSTRKLLQNGDIKMYRKQRNAERKALKQEHKAWKKFNKANVGAAIVGAGGNKAAMKAAKPFLKDVNKQNKAFFKAEQDKANDLFQTQKANIKQGIPAECPAGQGLNFKNVCAACGANAVSADNSPTCTACVPPQVPDFSRTECV